MPPGYFCGGRGEKRPRKPIYIVSRREAAGRRTGPAAGPAGLAVACGGPEEPGGEPGGDPGPVFAACERVLRPGGVLAVITGPAAPGGTLTDTAGSVVAAARAAGLVYAQHIV